MINQKFMHREQTSVAPVLNFVTLLIIWVETHFSWYFLFNFFGMHIVTAHNKWQWFQVVCACLHVYVCTRMCVGIIKLGVAQAESSVWDIAVSRKKEQQIFYRAVCEHWARSQIRDSFDEMVWWKTTLLRFAQ